MKTIFRASSIIEMHIVAGMLQANGIEPFANGQYLQGAVGGLPTGDFAIIQVKEEDEELALQLIEEYDNPPPAEDAPPESDTQLK